MRPPRGCTSPEIAASVLVLPAPFAPISADLRRRAVGDLAAEVQHRDTLARVHHQTHVVLDEQDREALYQKTADERAKRGGLCRVHAGGRLVQDQEARLRRESASDLESSLIAVRQLTGQGVRASPAETDAIDQRERERAMGIRHCPRTRHDPGKHVGAHASMSTDEDVLLDRETFEHADALERARDAERRETMRGKTRDVRPGETDRAAVGSDDARDEIDERGLARSVRADEAQRLALGDAQVDSIDRGDTAEALREADGLKQHPRLRCGRVVACGGPRRTSPGRAADR